MKEIKSKAYAVRYFDERVRKKDGLCAVKIRVTFKRDRRYYATGIFITKDDWDKINSQKKGIRRTDEQKEADAKIKEFEAKADAVLEKFKKSVFTFNAFENAFLEKRNIYDSVSFAFDSYISELKKEKRIGTAVSYECAKKSIETFKKGVKFSEITPKFLKEYHEEMIKEGKSETTIGIYLRSLRTIYNKQNIDKSIYPFGEEKDGKYTIPKGENIKKALTSEQVAMIYNYEVEPQSTKDRAKDYWLFLYLCNGMNVKDFCLLKWSDIEDDMLTYYRAKTKRTNKKRKAIQVALTTEAFKIIKKWGQPSISKEAYIFPHLHKGMTAIEERATYQQLTKTINKYMKRIAKELGIKETPTTYFARHSFATILKHSGANIAMISELLGHSSLEVTESYLGSFRKTDIQKQTSALTTGFKQAG